MENFYVYIDSASSAAIIHTAKCNRMRDQQQQEGQWHGFTTYAQARQFADTNARREVMECPRCNPHE